MESEVAIGVAGDGVGLDGLGEVVDGKEVEVHSVSPVLTKLAQTRGRLRSRLTGDKEGQGGEGTAVARVKVKQLSRLWEYRNGKSPEEKPPLLAVDEDGVLRRGTL